MKGCWWDGRKTSDESESGVKLTNCLFQRLASCCQLDSRQHSQLWRSSEEMLFWSGSAIGKADVVTIVSLVSASHCCGAVSLFGLYLLHGNRQRCFVTFLMSLG